MLSTESLQARRCRGARSHNAAALLLCSVHLEALDQSLIRHSSGLQIVTGVGVLAATALCGLVQAVAGGQPLLIVGVAEPIVLTYQVPTQPD